MKKLSAILVAFLLVALAVPLAVTGKAAPVEPATMETDEPAGKAVQEEGLAPLANAASDFSYTVANGAATITGYTGSSQTVVIPGTIGGYPVTAIGNKAFYARNNLISITLPESVTTIGDYAFYGCNGLPAFTIPDRVTTIGEGAFFLCSSVQSITIPETVTSIGADAFRSCGYLQTIEYNAADVKTSSIAFEDAGWDLGVSVTFGETVKQIPDYLFYGCTQLTSATIPDGVTGIGAYAFWGCRKLTAATIPESVTSLGAYAFSGSGLTKVTIPTGVTEIREGTFFGCESLTSAVIPAGVTSLEEGAFSSCISLTTATIPESVTSIGRYAFHNTSLTSATIPKNVKSIGECAFDSCDGLTEIVYNAARVPDITSWGAFTGAGSGSGQTRVKIGNTVERIPAYLFSGCTGLTTVTIADSVTEIGNHAFSNCPGLTAVTIPDSVTEIGDHAFSGCTGLTAVSLSERLTGLEESVFSGCAALETVTIPASVTSMGASVFSGCSSLTAIRIPAGVTSLETEVFSGCTALTTVTIPDSVTGIGTHAFYRCSSLASADLPESVTSLGEGAFSGCESLTAFTIPKNVTAIKKEAFRDCSSMTGIALPAGLRELGDYAFSGCGSLTEVAIPKGVKTIGQFAFAGCYELSSVTIREGVEAIGQGAFAHSTALTEIILPAGLTEIGENAFAAGSIRQITLPVSLTVVGAGAFSQCYSLSDVSYDGRETDWLRVSVGEKNDPLLQARYHFKEVPPEITEQPSGQTVPAGGTAVFTVTAEGSHLTYQWQYSEDGGESWISCDSPEGMTAVFRFTVSESIDGRLYRCVVTDEYGTVTTDAVKLTVIPAAAAQPAFKTQSLILSGEIGVIFYMDLFQLPEETRSESYVEFTVGKSDPVKVAFDPNKTNSKGYFGFTSYVKSIQMADTIRAVYHYGDGKTVTKEYSVARYIQAVEKNASSYDARTLELVRSIADFGHYAQIYLAEVNDWTIGEKYAEMSLHSAENYDYEDILSLVDRYAFDKVLVISDVTKASYKLHLDSETTVDVFLTTKDGKAPTNVTLTIREEATGNETTKEVTPVKQSDGRYLIRISGISAHKLGDMIIISGTAGNPFWVYVSALSYARSVLYNSSASGKAAKDCMCAMYAYYAATMAYRQNSSA